MNQIDSVTQRAEIARIQEEVRVRSELAAAAQRLEHERERAAVERRMLASRATRRGMLALALAAACAALAGVAVTTLSKDTAAEERMHVAVLADKDAAIANEHARADAAERRAKT